jgi:hypothetical protein
MRGFHNKAGQLTDIPLCPLSLRGRPRSLRRNELAFSRGLYAAVLLGILGSCVEAMADSIVIESTKDNGLKLARVDNGPTDGACIPEFALEGCVQEGESKVSSVEGHRIQVNCIFRGPMGQRCAVVETFGSAKNDVRWEVAVSCDDAKPWTAPLVFRLKYPATKETRFWTSWLEGAPGSDPKTNDTPSSGPDIVTWHDPLVAAPLTTNEWGLGHIIGKRGTCIPIATLLEPRADTGISLVVSPDQTLLHVTLRTEPGGDVEFRHEWLRLGGNRTVKLAADLVSHEADWRGGLRWTANRYPDFFHPPNPKVGEMAGTASYSHDRGKMDGKEVRRLRNMAYRVNWDAKFDWPYFGMFLPPMANADEIWQTYGYDDKGDRDPKLVRPISYRRANDECRFLKENGFYEISYFNITEFGSQIGKPDAVRRDLPEAESWRDATTLLYRDFPHAILKTLESDAPEFSWSNSVAVDASDPAFRAHLLEMARRQINFLPDAAGICVDRMDWLIHINYNADDGVGWYPGDHSGRLILLSWNSFMPELGKLMHSNGKVIFGNPSRASHRLNVVRELDGFYDEFGFEGFSLNGSSLLALYKPALMWTPPDGEMKPDADSYFQRHLYMGAFPTAPRAGNDHAVLPSPKIEQCYLDYGPLLDSLRGKKWVLEPHCVEAPDGLAKVNLFEVPGGWVLPVVFGPKDGSVEILIRNVRGISGAITVDALLPGSEQPRSLPAVFVKGVLKLNVPTHRGCAVVRIRRGD